METLASAISSSPRRAFDLSDGWEFLRRWPARAWLASPDGSGERIDLPHCWNVGEEFHLGSDTYYRGRGCYGKTFDAPAGEGLWLLEAGGFVGAGDLWLNGRRLARVDGMNLGFRLALGADFRPGSRNTIALRLDNRHRALPLPGYPEPDFFVYGGLAGGMRLWRLPETRILQSSVRILGRRLSSREPSLDVDFELSHAGDGVRSVHVEWRVVDAAGSTVATSPASTHELPARGRSGTLGTEIPLPPDVALWSPERPALHHAEARLRDAASGETFDAIGVRFGVREAEFRAGEGFFLNGERRELHGANRSENMPGFGNGLPEELHRRDAELLESIGCNFVRLSHAPQQDAFLDACDELGLLVYAEVSSWKSVRRGRWLRAAERQMAEMVRRYRNRPSVVVWGMGNESRSRGAYRKLYRIAKALDPSRPVTWAENHLHRARRRRCFGIPDLWGVNYELEVLDEAATRSRLGLTLVTECCRHAPAVKGTAEELTQLAVVEEDWERMAGHHHLCGHTVWCFADYATVYRQRYRRHAGLFDAWRAPKHAAWLFAARYADRPVLRLVATGGDEPELHVISNCDTVELEVDGEPAAPLSGGLRYVLPLRSEPSRVDASGARAGTVVEAGWRRAGEARVLHLAPERGLDTESATAASSPAEGLPTGCTRPFVVTVRDADGIRVRGWNGHVRLYGSDGVRLHPYTPDGEVLVADGEGRLFVTGRRPGRAQLRALCEGLDPAELDIEVRDEAATGPKAEPL